MGRNRRVSLPPSAGSAGGAVLLPIMAGQLAVWASAAGLHLTCDDLDSVAEMITDCLEWYPLWALIEHRRASQAPIRDWCNQVSEAAKNLLYVLGLGPAQHGTKVHQDALLHLTAGWNQKDEKDRYALQQLARLALQATPDRWQQRLSEGREIAGREAFGNDEYQRLAASLRLIETLSARAAEHHGHIELPGGKGRGSTRLGLFVNLSRAYRELFGALPTITRKRRQDDADSYRNAGPSWRFFLLLLTHVSAVAQHELDHLPSDGAADMRACWEELKKVASVASGLAGEGDSLAHLLRTSTKAIQAADKRRAAKDKAQESAG